MKESKIFLNRYKNIYKGKEVIFMLLPMISITLLSVISYPIYKVLQATKVAFGDSSMIFISVKLCTIPCYQ